MDDGLGQRVTEQLFGALDFLEFTRRHERGIDSERSAVLLDGTRVSVPQTGVAIFEPREVGPTVVDLVFSCGVHGNETAPIEICRDLVSEILRGELLVRNRVLFLIGNPVAVNLGRRFEAENLNRLFSGAHQRPLVPESYEARRAAELEAFVTRFFEGGARGTRRLHYDLHTAIRGSMYEKFAVYPYLPDGSWSERAIAELRLGGVDTVLLSNAPVGTFSYFSSDRFGADAFTVELGKVRPFGQNDPSRFVAITEVLRKLVAGEAVEPEPGDRGTTRLFAVKQVLIKETDDFVMNVADDVANFTEFPVGTVVTEDASGQYVVTEPGECIIFPNPYVQNTQRAGMILVPTALDRHRSDGREEEV